MAIGFGGKILGVRGGVRVGTKGIRYGVGAGPLKATGGHDFGSMTSTNGDSDVFALVIATTVAIAFFLTAGLGVFASFIPLFGASLVLLVPYPSRRSRFIGLGASTVIYLVVARWVYNYLHDKYFVRASDPDSSELFSVFVAIVMTGWIIGIASATFFFLYSIFRGKHLYDQIYLRPSK